MHLPLHWVSVIINFQQPGILYGDSLGQQMPKQKYLACEQWINHLIRQSSKPPIEGKISLGQLPTGQQLDSASCGLFALNSIAHHYLQNPLLPSDSTLLACR
jgi:Ulp1 family protease